MKRLSGALLTLLLALFLLPAVVLTLLSFLPSQTAQAIFQQEPAALSGLRLSTGLFLSRLPRRWQRALLALYVLSLLSPFQIIMLPVYKLSLLTGLYDSPWSVILLNVFAPIGPVAVCMLLVTAVLAVVCISVYTSSKHNIELFSRAVLERVAAALSPEDLQTVCRGWAKTLRTLYPGPVQLGAAQPTTGTDEEFCI